MYGLSSTFGGLVEGRSG